MVAGCRVHARGAGGSRLPPVPGAREPAARRSVREPACTAAPDPRRGGRLRRADRVGGPRGERVQPREPRAGRPAVLVDCYRRAIAFAADIGAQSITVTSGRRHLLLPAPAGRLEATFVEAFAEVARIARDAGLTVLFENHPQGAFPDTPSMARLLGDARFADVALLYDVTNALAIGEEPAAGIAAVIEHIGLVHLSDAPAGAWRHDPLGTGDVDLRAVLAALEAGGYDGPVVAEIISDAPLRDLVDARAHCATLLSTRRARERRRATAGRAGAAAPLARRRWRRPRRRCMGPGGGPARDPAARRRADAPRVEGRRREARRAPAITPSRSTRAATATPIGRADGRYGQDAMVEDLVCLVHALGDRRPALVGASMGGGTSLVAVGEDRVDATALVMVDIAPRTEPDGVERIKAFMRQKPDGFDTLEEVADAIASYQPHRAATAQPRRPREERAPWRRRQVSLALGSAFIARDIDVVKRLRGSKRAPRGCACRRCSCAAVCPTCSRRRARASSWRLRRTAEYVNVGSAGHMIAGDRNDAFGNAVIDFLARVVPVEASRCIRRTRRIRIAKVPTATSPTCPDRRWGRPRRSRSSSPVFARQWCSSCREYRSTFDAVARSCRGALRLDRHRGRRGAARWHRGRELSDRADRAGADRAVLRRARAAARGPHERLCARRSMVTTPVLADAALAASPRAVRGADAA